MAINNISGCIGCEECIKSCPTDVIRLNPSTKKAEIIFPEDCQICHLCRMYCPVDAITISPDKSIPVIVSHGVNYETSMLKSLSPNEMNDSEQHVPLN